MRIWQLGLKNASSSVATAASSVLPPARFAQTMLSEH